MRILRCLQLARLKGAGTWRRKGENTYQLWVIREKSSRNKMASKWWAWGCQPDDGELELVEEQEEWREGRRKWRRVDPSCCWRGFYEISKWSLTHIRDFEIENDKMKGFEWLDHGGFSTKSLGNRIIYPTDPKSANSETMENTIKKTAENPSQFSLNYTLPLTITRLTVNRTKTSQTLAWLA